jgi:Tol biopolymer transport system component
VTITAPPRPPRPGDPVDRDELEALVNALIEEARRRARRRRRIFVAVVASAALIGVAVFVAFDRTAQSQSASSTLAARPGPAAAQARSKIAFTTFYQLRRGKTVLNRTELYVMNPDGSGKRMLAATLSKPQSGTGLGWGSVWSPDGSELAVGRSGQLVVMSPDGVVRRILTADGGVDAPAWSSDGRRIAFSATPSTGSVPNLYVMNADGSGQRRVTKEPIHVWGASWSPEGQWLAFASGVQGNPGNFKIYVVNVDGSGQRQLTRGWPDQDPAWSPAGQRIAFLSYRDEQPTGGRRWQKLLNVMNADGSEQQRLTRLSNRDGSFSWSPDGRRIAFVSDRDGNDEVYVMNADGSGQRNLTRNPGRDGHPVWSPDGRTIGFVSDRGGNRDIYVMNTDGSRQRNLTSDFGHQAFGIAWMPTPKS